MSHKSRKSIPLTVAEWREVFRVRCKSRRGDGMTEDERRLIGRAFAEDPRRYAGLDADVFDATVPAGSTARAKR